MSKEKAKEFLIAFRQEKPDEAFAKRFREAHSDDERFALYAEAAAGCDVTASDFRDALKELDAERTAKTKEAVQDLEALDDDEVENVAGGVVYVWGDVDGERQKVPGCVIDFTDDDCYVDDACHIAFNQYHNCEGTYYAAWCRRGDYIENGTNKG